MEPVWRWGPPMDLRFSVFQSTKLGTADTGVTTVLRRKGCTCRYSMDQGCQIFLDTMHQTGEIYQTTTEILPNVHLKCKNCPPKIPTFSIPRHSKIYPNWDWFENILSGNPVIDRFCKSLGIQLGCAI
jgi:hypothetical protein